MDADGFFDLRLRAKRMIKPAGMNVDPAEMEEQPDKHPAVEAVCISGLPDEKQVEHAKGFVVLSDPTPAGPAMQKELIDFCRKNLILRSCPCKNAFRSALPLTLVGKVAFAALAAEEAAKREANRLVKRLSLRSMESVTVVGRGKGHTASCLS